MDKSLIVSIMSLVSHPPFLFPHFFFLLRHPPGNRNDLCLLLIKALKTGPGQPQQPQQPEQPQQSHALVPLGAA